MACDKLPYTFNSQIKPNSPKNIERLLQEMWRQLVTAYNKCTDEQVVNVSPGAPTVINNITGGSGDDVLVNDVDVGPIVNLDDDTPVAPVGYTNVKWQKVVKSGGHDVSAYYRASLPLNKPLNADTGAWIGGMINRLGTDISGLHAPYMHGVLNNSIRNLRYAIPIGGFFGDILVYTNDALISGQHDCFALDANMSQLNISGGAGNDGFADSIFTTPLAAAGSIGSENLMWRRVDPGSCLQLAAKQLATGGTGTWRSWAGLFAPDGNYQFIGGNASGAVGFGTPQYDPVFGVRHDPDETNVEMVAPFDCTIDQMWVWTTATQVTESADVVLRKNEADTPLTVNIPNGAPSGPYVDLVNSVSVTKGQRVNFKTTQNVSGTGAAFQGIFVRVTPSSGSPRWIGGIVEGYNHNRGEISWSMLFSRWTPFPASDVQTRMPCPRPGTIQDAYVWIRTAGTGDATADFEFAVAGVGGNPTVSVGVGETGAKAGTGSKVVVRGDECNIKTTTGGTAGSVPDVETWSAAIV